MRAYHKQLLTLTTACSAVMFLGLTGCSDRTPEPPPAGTPAQPTETAASTLSLAEQFAEAIAAEPILDTAPLLFTELLNETMANEGRPAAQALYAKYLALDPDIADSGYSIISSSFVDTNAFPAFVSWVDALLIQPLPEPLEGRVFANKLEVMVMMGQIEPAQEELLAALAAESRRGDAALGTISRALAQTERDDLVLAWTQRLVDSDLRADYRARALGWHVGAHLRAGTVEPVMQRLPQCVELLTETDLKHLLAKVFQTWNLAKHHASVDKALTTVRPLLQEGHGLTGFLFTEEVKTMVGSKRWGDAAALFKSEAAALSSDARRTAFRSLKSGTRKAGNWADLEALGEHIMSEFDSDTDLRDEAAGAWLQSTREQHKLGLLAERFKRGVDLGVNARVLMREYAASLYAVMSGAQNAILAELMQVGDALKKYLTEEVEQNQLTTLMFDGAFILEDYDRVMEVLNSGLPGKDEDWHGMAKNKVLAHKAMKEGDYKAAAARFRDFMGFVDKTWERPEADPSTGVMHTREMALGFNARRIADLLKKAGDTLQAETTYREALGYYETAIATAEAGSKEHAIVSQAIAELRQALGADEK